jgi:sugar phosphate isomerase/epimerase
VATEPVALELYTVRALTKEDFLGTLKKLAEGGCTAVEFAGYGGISAKSMKSELDALGITAAGSHVGYKLWDEDLNGTIKDLLLLDLQYATIPWLEPAMRPTTADDVKALAKTFSVWQKACKTAGIRLGYHNHEFEFNKVDGVTIYDMLAESTDLDLQLDVYWAKFIGFDAVPLIEKYAGRMPQIHVKDYAKDGTGADAVFGEGAVDWDRVLPAAHKSGTKWYIAEQDTPTDPLADSIRGLKNLRAKLAELDIA